MARALDYFTSAQVERARRYHRPLYLLFLLGLLIDFAVLALLAWGPPGDWIDRWLDSLPVWAQSMAWPALVVSIGWLVGLPLSFWRGYIRERRWGFATQSPAGWFVDRLKGLAVGIVLTTGVMAGFVAIARWWPTLWPAVAAPAAAAVVLFLSFVAPVLLEPVFNRFRPLDDEALVADLRSLADRAGVPIRDVLVADASRRTKKENAYVSGLGKTRRVVLYDNLLARADPSEVRLVAAHELGHRRMRHVAWWTIIGMVGAAGSVLVLWWLLEQPSILRAIGALGAGDPRVVPFVILAAGAFQWIFTPIAAALSRRWETAADRFAFELSPDPGAFERSFHALAVTNLLDLDPPRLMYLLTFTHPTPAERIEAGRRWAAGQDGLRTPAQLRTPNPPTTGS